MKKVQRKIFLIIVLALLFLITSIGQARAAAGQAKAATVYRVDYNAIAKSLHYYLWEPTADLALFTGQNLGRTFKSFPPAVKATKSYFQATNYLGRISKNTLGLLFNNTGNLLAGVGQHLPNFVYISQDTGNFVASAITVFEGSGQVFKSTGDTLAAVPSYIIRPSKNIIALNKIFVTTGRVLAAIPQNIHEYPKALKDTVNASASAISYLKNSGQVFKVAGDALAIIPNNLPNLKEVSLSYGNLLIAGGDRINDAVAFFQDTFNNLTNTPKKQNYPHTQSLITNARRNLENNFNRLIGVSPTEASQLK